MYTSNLAVMLAEAIVLPLAIMACFSRPGTRRNIFGVSVTILFVCPMIAIIGWGIAPAMWSVVADVEPSSLDAVRRMNNAPGLLKLVSSIVGVICMTVTAVVMTSKRTATTAVPAGATAG